ncbi:MAG: cytochrome c3 family protein [Deferribacterota bacterium]|nr:cytochrome c3 family protein [Deferribacterota bacterium]
MRRLIYYVVFFITLYPLIGICQSEQQCLNCHKYVEPKVDVKELNESVHKGLSCISCHSDIENIPHKKNLKPVKCLNCHGKEEEMLSKSIHSNVFDDLSRMCKECHGSHNIYKKDDINSTINPMNLPNTCSKCHQDEKFVADHKLPSTEFIKDFKGSVHGKALSKSGLIVSATCSSCHGYHLILSPKDDNSTINRKNVTNTCGKCHLGILKRYNSSIHREALVKGNKNAPVCTTCHSSHQIKDIDRLMLTLLEEKECGGCHIDKAPSYEDSFHGKATSLGFVRAALCSDCHNPHLILPTDNPRSTVNKNNLKETCGKCHKNATDAFISFIAHPDPHNKEANPLLYYIYLFMTLLLISVFGFFGIHDILWLQRSIVALVKGELKRFSYKDKWVKRFSNVTIYTHLAIIISFLGLAATGIPLKFHYAGWAQTLANIFGGVEVARFVHRVCAVITFGYGVSHLIYLIYKIIIRKDLSYLIGQNSLVPRFKDFVDLYNNIRWFFYLGKRPDIGHFNYWEKFDYFAVFWGIPVIGFSGLILWFPEFFAQFLPGIALNIAAIVHGEEALLAIGFIFMFHFFHTHLRPESFPLDTVVFLGKQPLERLKDERPEEYEELVKTGKLDELIVEPPSEDLIRLSKIFGFIFLGIGLALIIAILITFIVSII